MCLVAIAAMVYGLVSMAFILLILVFTMGYNDVGSGANLIRYARIHAGKHEDDPNFTQQDVDRIGHFFDKLDQYMINISCWMRLSSPKGFVSGDDDMRYGFTGMIATVILASVWPLLVVMLVVISYLSNKEYDGKA